MSEQVPTRTTTATAVLRSAAFNRGVGEVRAGRPPQFDSHPDDWDYERGRLFAVIAPPTLPIVVDGKLKRKALQFLKRAFLMGIGREEGRTAVRFWIRLRL
jgi:hypothetical protein